MIPRKKYYLPFKPKAKINYLLLLDLADIAEYNPDTKMFDTINYQSVYELLRIINAPKDKKDRIAESTFYRNIHEPEYKDFLVFDKENKQIRLFADMTNCGQPFVVLTENEVSIIRAQTQLSKTHRNLLLRYFMYIKYFCGYSRNKQTDSTAKQILCALGYSPTANNYISLLATFNSILEQNKLLKIQKKKDDSGFFRNIYFL